MVDLVGKRHHTLSVSGPNAHGGAFHVHTADCADLGKAVYRRSAAGHEMQTHDFTSRRDVVEFLFADFIAENESSWQDYAREVRFFPCCKRVAYDA